LLRTPKHISLSTPQFTTIYHLVMSVDQGWNCVKSSTESAYDLEILSPLPGTVAKNTQISFWERVRVRESVTIAP
jgi:hypothetical protein